MDVYYKTASDLTPRWYTGLDLDMVNHWLELRGSPPFKSWMLPDEGMIVDGVACGFLYRTNSRVGLIESAVTNPEASSEFRHIALDKIMKAIELFARQAGMKMLVGFPRVVDIDSRMVAAGYHSSGPFTRVMKELV